MVDLILPEDSATLDLVQGNLVAHHSEVEVSQSGTVDSKDLDC